MLTLQIPDLPSARIILYSLRRSARAYGMDKPEYRLLIGIAGTLEADILAAELPAKPVKTAGAKLEGSGV